MIPRARSPHASSAVVSEWAPALGTACAALLGIAITELTGEGTSRYSLTLATSSCAKAMNLRRSFSATSRSSAPKAVSSLFVTSWSSRLGDDLTSRFCLDCSIEKVVSCLLLWNRLGISCPDLQPDQQSARCLHILCVSELTKVLSRGRPLVLEVPLLPWFASEPS